MTDDVLTLDELADRLGFTGEHRGRRALRLLRRVEEDRGVYLVEEHPHRRPRYVVRWTTIREHLRHLQDEDDDEGQLNLHREVETLQESVRTLRRELHVLRTRVDRLG